MRAGFVLETMKQMSYTPNHKVTYMPSLPLLKTVFARALRVRIASRNHGRNRPGPSQRTLGLWPGEQDAGP